MKRVAVLLFVFATTGETIMAVAAQDRPVLADVQTVVQGNNRFAVDLYARLHVRDGNLFYSPYSIESALAMTSAGARGATAEEMARVLHYSLDAQRLHPAFAELTRELNGRGLPRDYQLNVAQSLWGDAGLSTNPDFDRLIRANYGARLRRVQFNQQPDEARRQINRWVEERTNDKIKDLLQQGDVDSRTRLVLVNAIYFKAAWQHPFLKAATKDDLFLAADKQTKVSMMHQAESFRYAEDGMTQVLELPYESDELSMVIVLPREQDGLGKLEQALTAAKLDGWLGGLSARHVDVELPRFKLQARFELAAELSAMGMPLAFTPGADFSGISKTEKLMISKVIHQAFVNVDEEGTEAAAATAVVMMRASAPEKSVAFRADHPFLFLIREKSTGTILFVGRVTNPV
jgi:serine protease inhibitor